MMASKSTSDAGEKNVISKLSIRKLTFLERALLLILLRLCLRKHGIRDLSPGYYLSIQESAFQRTPLLKMRGRPEWRNFTMTFYMTSNQYQQPSVDVHLPPTPKPPFEPGSKTDLPPNLGTLASNIITPDDSHIYLSSAWSSACPDLTTRLLRLRTMLKR